VKSKLDSIMTTYLRAQHRQCAAPIAACAPFSLLEPHACPEPRHELAAPRNLGSRLARREWYSRHPRGGPGGRARDRHFVFGRFRSLRGLRDEGAVLTTAAFVGGDGDRLLAGSHEGEIRLFDAGNGDMLELHDGGHSGPIRTLRASPPSCAKSLALSCSSTEVNLWDVSAMGHGTVHVFEGSCNGAFGHGAKHLAVVGEDLVGTMRLVDCSTGGAVHTFTPTPLPSGGGGGAAPRLHHSMRYADVCFSPGDGGLLLWGNLLWDVRLPHPVQRFDRFSDGGGACFHPAGNEVVINSEVWDLRSDRLLRSVPALDGTQLSWTGSGDVALASFRLPKEESIFITLRRTKHPLRAAFRTIDAADYSEISHVEVVRSLVDSCWDHGTDSLCATVEYDAADTLDSVVRVHEVGRLRPGEEDSDADGDEDEDGAGNGDEDDSELDDLELAAMEEDDDEEEEEEVQARTALAGLRTLLGRGRGAGAAGTAALPPEGADEDDDDETPWEPDEDSEEDEAAFDEDDDDDEEDEEEDDEEDDEEEEDDHEIHRMGIHVQAESDSGEDDEDDESVLLSLGESDDDSDGEGESDDSEEVGDGDDGGGGSGWLHG